MGRQKLLSLLRISLGFVVSPWAASTVTAGILSIWQGFRFDQGIFWSYFVWLGIGGQIISILVCAPIYVIASRLSKLTFAKVVIGSALSVGGSVGLLSLTASSQGMRAGTGFAFDLVFGSFLYGLMGALGGIIFYSITRPRSAVRKSKAYSAE